MKIRYKVFSIFSVIAILAGFVAISSYHATLTIFKAFEGGEDYFITIIRSAMEVDSNAKRAEGHLMLYLTLHEPIDRDSFFIYQEKLIVQIEVLSKNVSRPQARTILKDIKSRAFMLQSVGETLIATYASDMSIYGFFNPKKRHALFKRFFTLSEQLMTDLAKLVDQETNFLNKQYAITDAALISRLAKSAESKLLLYMALNDDSDLERYLLNFSVLKKTAERLDERLNGDAAKIILARIKEEVDNLGAYGASLFESFHSLQQQLGAVDMRKYDQKIRQLHTHSSAIRELGLELSNLMAEQEHEKRIETMRNVSSIQRNAFFLIFLGGVLTLILGYILSAAIAKPIVKLKEAAEEIGKGNLDAHADIQGKNELSDLGTSFHKMAGDLKTARDELLAAKEYTDNIIRSMSDSLFVVSPDGTIRTVNHAACRLLDYDANELMGKPFSQIFEDNQDNSFDPVTFDESSNIGPVEASLVCQNGEMKPVSFSSSRMYDRQGEKIGTVCVAQDMTERKKALHELRLLAAVVDQAAEAIMISSPQGKIEYVNPAFCKITGYTRQEARGETTSLLKSGKHSDLFYEELWKTIKKGNTWRGHLINCKKDGSFYEEECSIFPVYDERKKLMNYVSIKRDVTKEMRLERQLQQSQRHQALGTLAGGIAHDFNNILSGMLTFVEGALNEIDSESDIYKNLKEVIIAGERAADLVHQILTFSRPTKQERLPVRLQPVIKGALKFIRGTIPSTIELVEDISFDCPVVKANPTQIHQVLVNLCANASHAIGENQGTITISLQEESVTEELASEHTDLHVGDYVKLSVVDTGRGIEDDIIDRIFEPYFTTRKYSKGTGLGLSTVQGIIKSHDGAILVESEKQGGTCFDIYLPKTSFSSPKEKKADTKKSTGKIFGRIMFVDDELMIVQSMKIVLRQAGCDVTTFSNSLKALEAFEKDPEKFDLVVTDQTMPKLSGSELAKKILEIRPNIPIILTTGYTDVIDEIRARSIGIREFIMKPMPVDKLISTVWSLLAEKKESLE